MFDISFTELMVIGVIALIVIGPERLPKVARTVGHLLGRAQRYVNDVKSDIRREVELDELRNLRNEMQDAARSFENSIHREVDEVRAGVSGVAESVAQAGRDMAADAAPADLAGPPAAAGSPSASLPDSPAAAGQGVAGAAPTAPAVAGQATVPVASAGAVPPVMATASPVADPLAADTLPAEPDLQLELPLGERSAAGAAPVTPSAAAPVPPVTTQERPGP